MRRIAFPLATLLSLAMVPAVAAAADDVSGTLALDPTQFAGSDTLGRVMLYTPTELAPGSSVSHWDRSASPDLLMEPNASPLVPVGTVDLTLPNFNDLGWPQGGSTITVRVTDGDDEGFNDPTDASEVPNNPGGTTLGGQRLAAIEWAADIWAGLLGSSVEINLDAAFSELDCDDTGAVLAQAGPASIFFNFPNAPREGMWYATALAEALAGENLSTTEDGGPVNAGDLSLTFNSQIDEGCVSPSFRYYYGLDGNTPNGQIAFAMVALHEMAHGLGFISFVNPANGLYPVFPGSGLPQLPDIFSSFLFDVDLQLHWDEMTNVERRNSAINPNRVVWDGPQVTDAAPDFLENAPTLTINSPSSIAGTYLLQGAFFGPPINETGITGDLVVAFDSTDQPKLACETLANASEVAGKIAVIDRGECNFTVKVKNAQDVGAIAVLIVNNQPVGLPPMGGEDPTVTIPSAGISKADGDRIKRALGMITTDPLRPTRRLAPN
jgi:hypothetical protein